MKRFALLLVLSCSLVPVSLALEDTAAASDSERGQPKQLGTELDQFVREAINEGLLTPNGAGDVAETTEDAVEIEAPPLDVRRRQPAPFPEEVDCTGPNPLDFSDLEAFDRYQQIHTFQEGAAAPDGAGESASSFTLAKAYLALGLYSEAAMMMKSIPGPDATAYRKVASLMENRERADVDYFRKLADCHERAGIWLAAALLANDQDEGVAQLNDNLNGFRKLPFRLRADLAAMVVPQLDKRGERVLPVKLFADFTPEQVDGATQLQFVRAIIGLGESRPDSDKAVRSFLNDPEYQEEALAALMRRGKPLGGVHEEILLGGLMKKFGQTGDDRALAASLQYALQELSDSSHYQPIMELAGMPALQNEAAQSEIRRQFTKGLERDLSSDNRLRNLAAINALVSDPGILDAAPEKTGFYRSGASLAVRFGLVSLTRALMSREGADDSVITELAGLEFERGDYDAVSTWAETYPDNASLNLLAAEAAIRQGNVTALRGFEARLAPEPEDLLTLIELDAAEGHWIVSDAVYAAATRLTDPVQKQRAERVFEMRQAARDLAAKPKRKLTMAKVATVLKRPDASTSKVTGGAN
jgi:HEPN domain-containing protein